MSNEEDARPSESAELPGGQEQAAQNVIADSVPAPTKTPLFQAINAVRYQRQAIIKKIEARTGRVLICYVAGAAASIHRDDTLNFVDLLHNVPRDRDLDLMLHTPGGDIDAAEKLITMVRNRIGAAILRIVIPDYAKSAGTLMALGADIIIMSDTSELGPIDPQVILSDSNGNRIAHSVQGYLDAYETHSATLKVDPNNVAAQIMLNKLDPATVKLFESARERARVIAETQLKQGMFRDGRGAFTKTAAALLDTKKWLSHSQMISWQDASDPGIGLVVEYIEPCSTEWQEYWQLYCLQRLAVVDGQKIFESGYASLVIDSSRG